MRRIFSRHVAGLTAAAGLLFSNSKVMLEQSEQKNELSDLETSKPSQVEPASQTSSSDENAAYVEEENKSTTPSSQSSSAVYGIFFTEAVKQNLLKLYPAKFSNIYADHVLLNKFLSPEDHIELEKMLGTKYQACLYIAVHN